MPPRPRQPSRHCVRRHRSSARKASSSSTPEWSPSHAPRPETSSGGSAARQRPSGPQDVDTAQAFASAAQFVATHSAHRFANAMGPGPGAASVAGSTAATKLHAGTNDSRSTKRSRNALARIEQPREANATSCWAPRPSWAPRPGLLGLPLARRRRWSSTSWRDHEAAGAHPRPALGRADDAATDIEAAYGHLLRGSSAGGRCWFFLAFPPRPA